MLGRALAVASASRGLRALVAPSSPALVTLQWRAASASAAPKKAAAAPAATAAAADAAAAPSPTTKRKLAVTVPTPGDAPPGAAWRRSPLGRASGEWMKDETVEEAYANLAALAGNGYRYAPRASALERVLARVREGSADDLAVAVKAYNVCLSKGTQLTDRTAMAFAAAAVRAGDPDAALTRFRDPARSRLFPTPGAMLELLRAAETRKDAALLKRVAALLRAKRIEEALLRRHDRAWLLMAAQAAVGDVAAALGSFAAMAARFPARLAKHAHSSRVLLDALLAAPEAAAGAEAGAAAAAAPLSDASLAAVVRDSLLPTARLFPALAERVAKVEARYAAQLSGAPAASAPAVPAAPASEPAAAAAPAAEAPKA